MMTFLGVSTIKLLGQLDPYFSSTNLAQNDAIDLMELGFMFYIQDIDKSVGTIHAEHTSWEKYSSDK